MALQARNQYGGQYGTTGNFYNGNGMGSPYQSTGYQQQHQPGSPYNPRTPLPPIDHQKPIYDEEILEPDDRVEVIADRLARTERSTKTLLEQALAIQLDIEENFHLSQNAYRGEKNNHDLLKDHIRTITYVVKTLSREVDVMEERMLGALQNVRQLVKDVKATQDQNLVKLGWTSQQQEFVNTRVREVFQTLAGEQKIFQARVYDELRQTNLRLDSLAVKVTSINTSFEEFRGKQQHTNKDTSGFLQQLKGRIEALDVELKAIAGTAHHNQRRIQESERRHQQTEANMQTDSKNVRDTFERDRKATAELCQQLDTHLRAKIERSQDHAAVQRDELTNQLKQWTEAQISIVTQNMEGNELTNKQSFQNLEEAIHNTTIQLQETIQTSMALVDEKRDRLARRLVKQLGEANQNTDLVSTLMQRKYDVLEEKVAKILQTIVLV